MTKGNITSDVKLILSSDMGFPGGLDSKEPICNAGDPGSIPGSEDHLEKGTATYSNILAWRSPWTEEPGRLQSMGLQRVWHDWAAITLIFHPLIHDKKGISPLRYFRNRSTYVCTTDFQQKCKGDSIEKGWSFQQMVLEQWAIAMQRNKFLSILMPCSKIIVKYVIDLKVKLNIVKLSEENVGEKCRTLVLC